MKLESYEGVKIWAKEKGIYDKSSPIAQCEKFMEEALELKEEIDNLHSYPYPETLLNAKMELGDVLVTLINLSEVAGFDMDECLTMAYEKINKRSGKMVKGVFVKDE